MEQKKNVKILKAEDIEKAQQEQKQKEEQAGKDPIKELQKKMDSMITPEGARLAVIRIGGKRIPLNFCLDDVEPLNEDVGPVTDIRELLTTDYLSTMHVKRVVRSIRIMGNSGLIEMGQEPNLTDGWISRHLKVKDITDAVIFPLILTVWGGMEMETEQAEEQEGKEVDVVLQEINKKKEG